jgi:AcrR family transcriptional regulator
MVASRVATAAPRPSNNNGYDVIIMRMGRARAPEKRQATAPEAALPGTPAWWASRQPRPAARTRGRPPRSFEPIIAAAAELIDEGSLSTFSMRALAQRLDTSTATLYRHVTGREELMVHVVDRLLGELRASPAGGPPPRGWQDALRRRFLLFHRALSDHPNLLPLLASQVPVGPNGLAVREETITELATFGFPVALAARVYTTLGHYVIGFLAQAHAPEALAPGQAAALRAYYRGLDPMLYPSTVVAADALTTVSPQDEFLEGLQFILDGIEAARSRGED